MFLRKGFPLFLPQNHRTFKESKLVAAVEDQIAVNPSVFHKFLSMLREDPSLVYIADGMSDLYRKCSSIIRCFVAKPALTWNSTL